MIFIFINTLENNSTHNSKCLLPKSKDLSIWKPLFPNGKIYIFWTKNETPFRKMCHVLFRIDFDMRYIIFANKFFVSLLMLSKIGLFIYYREFLKYKITFFLFPNYFILLITYTYHAVLYLQQEVYVIKITTPRLVHQFSFSILGNLCFWKQWWKGWQHSHFILTSNEHVYENTVKYSIQRYFPHTSMLFCKYFHTKYV